eukprot:9898887-Ditylum_brightwellii.AAC.1
MPDTHVKQEFLFTEKSPCNNWRCTARSFKAPLPCQGVCALTGQEFVDNKAHLHPVKADDDVHLANIDNKDQESINREAPKHP